MVSHRRQPRRKTWPAWFCLMWLVSCETVPTRTVRHPGEGAGFVRQLEQAFPDLLYQGAYLDDETGYLVIALRVHPGRLAARAATASAGLDLVLAQLIVDGIYEPRFASHLAANPGLKGVTVLITWDGCRRILEGSGAERILLTEGISEYDRFDVNRQLYFTKINRMALGVGSFETGKLFDNIVFSHSAVGAYKEQPFHEQHRAP